MQRLGARHGVTQYSVVEYYEGNMRRHSNNLWLLNPIRKVDEWEKCKVALSLPVRVNGVCFFEWLLDGWAGRVI